MKRLLILVSLVATAAGCKTLPAVRPITQKQYTASVERTRFLLKRHQITRDDAIARVEWLGDCRRRSIDTYGD